MFFNNKHYVGGYGDGIIYEISNTTYTDNGATIRRTRTAPPVLSTNRERLFFHRIELEFKAGTGLATGTGSDPQAMLSWSNDGGRTWSSEYWTDIGEIGEYTTRAIWRRTGQARQRMFRLEVSDPIECVIVGSYADITKGRA